MKKRKKFVTMNQTKYNKKISHCKKKIQINRFPLMLMIDILTDEWSTQSRKAYFEIYT